MMTSRRLTRLAGAALLTWAAVVPPAPIAAQSAVGPAPMGFDPRTTSRHFHEGELGDLWLAIEHSLKCNCGSCAMDVHTCQFQMQCGTSPVWSQRIRESLEAGQSPEAIQASFVADFGMTVLMAPPAEGFNLVGYFLPAVAIITAGMLVGLLSRRGAPRNGPVPITEVADEDAERLRAEWEKVDAAESPDW